MHIYLRNSKGEINAVSQGESIQSHSQNIRAFIYDAAYDYNFKQMIFEVLELVFVDALVFWLGMCEKLFIFFFR